MEQFLLILPENCEYFAIKVEKCEFDIFWSIPVTFDFFSQNVHFIARSA